MANEPSTLESLAQAASGDDNGDQSVPTHVALALVLGGALATLIAVRLGFRPTG